MQTDFGASAAALRQELPGNGNSTAYAPDPTRWDRELDELYAALTGRGGFRWDAGRDPLWAAYSDRAQAAGRLAMRDTMGRAAALTGGYGSSYAQAVGQQQYGEYLRGLSEAMPDFYELAYRRWQDEGARLADDYDRLAARRREEAEAAAAAEQTAYQRQRDALADARREADDAAAADKTAYQRRQDSYNALVRLISASGYEPTDAELASAGLSRAAAEALLRQYRLDNPEPAAAGAVWYGGGSGGTQKKSAARRRVKEGPLNAPLPASLGSSAGGKGK